MRRRLVLLRTTFIPFIWLAASSFGMFFLPVIGWGQNPIATNQSGSVPCKVTSDARPAVDQKKSGGPRGTLKVMFVVTLNGQDIEGAVIEVHSTGCKLVDEGTTDDRGLFIASLEPGDYSVSLKWRENRIERQIRVDLTTKQIKLPLEKK